MDNSQVLKGRVAIVTGSAQGIGKVVAMGFARAGASVVIADVKPTGEAVTAEILSQNWNAVFFQTNVSKKEEVQRMVSGAREALGPIDILVNCAGINNVNYTVLDQPEEIWDDIIAVNLKGTFLCCQAVVPDMIDRKHGKIVNIASRAGETGRAKSSAYAASKSGVIGLTRTLALELAQYRINVNAAIPGSTDTPMWRKDHTDEAISEKKKMDPLLTGVKEPEDLLGLFLFLVSDASRLMTGKVLSFGYPF